MVGQSIRESSGWMDVDKITGKAPNWINLYERLYRIKLRWQKWLIWFNLRASESIWVFRGRRRDPGPSNPRLRQSCGLCQLLIACEHSQWTRYGGWRDSESFRIAHTRSRKFSEKLKISLMDAVGVSCCWPCDSYLNSFPQNPKNSKSFVLNWSSCFKKVIRENLQLPASADSDVKVFSFIGGRKILSPLLMSCTFPFRRNGKS